jgi:hypothetical protein
VVDGELGVDSDSLILLSSMSWSTPPCPRCRSIVRLVVMVECEVKSSAEDLSDA